MSTESSTILKETRRRRTFAVISHPDAGKSTLTEALALHARVITEAGAVHGKAGRQGVTSDWMAMERQRGISVTSAALQFEYRDVVLNLLDTPGHADFSEDTYRVLSAVDCAVMLLDAAKGLEPQTLKLFDVCRHRGLPVITFINKWDRPGREALDLLDEIEQRLGITPTPVTWPIGIAGHFEGLIDRRDAGRVIRFSRTAGGATAAGEEYVPITEPLAQELSGLGPAVEELDLLDHVGADHDEETFLAGASTPVFFGAAVSNIGVRLLLDAVVDIAPAPASRRTSEGEAVPLDGRFSGLVFKIQANMDPAHRDRIAFMRICSGRFTKGMKLRHVRLGRDIRIADAVTFLAADRQHADQASAGDIIGLHNHGTINIGDTFTEGEALHFTGIPSFAPELFRRAVLRDPLRMKALSKGLDQLCEEGATQVFRPMIGNALILGAVGPLQFDVVADRLKHEYGVECHFEGVQVATARWVYCDDERRLEEFRRKAAEHLAIDHGGALVYVAPTRVNLSLTQERWPEIEFRATREKAPIAA